MLSISSGFGQRVKSLTTAKSRSLLSSHAFIIELISQHFPQHSFLGEETGLTPALAESSTDQRPAGSNSENDKVIWMIDPLDGTTNYIHQFPFFCISIGLEINGELVL